jgi:hypothetical protein
MRFFGHICSESGMAERQICQAGEVLCFHGHINGMDEPFTKLLL